MGRKDQGGQEEAGWGRGGAEAGRNTLKDWEKRGWKLGRVAPVEKDCKGGHEVRGTWGWAAGGPI